MYELDTNMIRKPISSGNTSNQKSGNILLHISSIFELALNCCNDAPEARPDMSQIVVSLGKLKAIFIQNIQGNLSLLNEFC